MARVCLGMSGGVDSSAAAVLLRDAGYDVHGLHLSLLGALPLPEGCVPDDGADAAAAAKALGLPFHEIDLSERFRRSVADYFIREYEAGRTPNPCVFCNREIKFGAMWETALALGADCLATGHYARIARDPATGRYLLRRGADPLKDQSYFLCRLTQEQLSRTLFPLGGLSKPRVRALAAEAGLRNAGKRDSQDICFVPDGDYVGLIERCVGHPSPTGAFLDRNGTVLGRHKGFIRYTKGQHKGLGLPAEPPLYVLGKDPHANAILLGHNEDLFAAEAVAGDWNWISVSALTAPMEVTAKLRYSRRESAATAEPLADGRVRLRFREPQRAVTPGQFAVLYDGETVVGGGIIEE